MVRLRGKRWFSAASAFLGGIAPLFGMAVAFSYGEGEPSESVYTLSFFATPVFLLIATVGLWGLQSGRDWHLTGIGASLFALSVVGLGAWGLGLVLVPPSVLAVAIGSLRARTVPGLACWLLVASVVGGTLLAWWLEVAFDADAPWMASALVASVAFALGWLAIGRTLWAHPRLAVKEATSGTGARTRRKLDAPHVFSVIFITVIVALWFAGSPLIWVAVPLVVICALALTRLKTRAPWAR